MEYVQSAEAEHPDSPSRNPETVCLCKTGPEHPKAQVVNRPGYLRAAKDPSAAAVAGARVKGLCLLEQLSGSC